MEKITKEEYFNKIDILEEKYKNIDKELKEAYKQKKIYIIEKYKNKKADLKDNEDMFKIEKQNIQRQYYKDRHEIINKYTYD